MPSVPSARSCSTMAAMRRLRSRHIVSSALDAGLRDRPLREQGVHRDHPFGEEHVLQDGVHRADLVRLLVHRRLRTVAPHRSGSAMERPWRITS